MKKIITVIIIAVTVIAAAAGALIATGRLELCASNEES